METLITQMQMESWPHAFGQFFTDKIIGELPIGGWISTVSLKPEVESPIHYALINGDEEAKGNYGNGQGNGRWRHDCSSFSTNFRWGQCRNLVLKNSCPWTWTYSQDITLTWQGRSSQVHKIQIWSHFLPIFAGRRGFGLDQNQPQVLIRFEDESLAGYSCVINGQFLKSTKQSYCEGNETWRSDWFEQKSHGSCWRRFELSLKVVQPAENLKMSITELLNGAGQFHWNGDRFGS